MKAAPKKSLTIYFTDNAYIGAHGKKPRGYGRWIFEELTNTSGPGLTLEAPASMTLTEAKLWLRRHLLSYEVHGFFTVKVCP